MPHIHITGLKLATFLNGEIKTVSSQNFLKCSFIVIQASTKFIFKIWFRHERDITTQHIPRFDKCWLQLCTWHFPIHCSSLATCLQLILVQSLFFNVCYKDIERTPIYSSRALCALIASLHETRYGSISQPLLTASILDKCVINNCFPCLEVPSLVYFTLFSASTVYIRRPWREILAIWPLRMLNCI